MYGIYTQYQILIGNKIMKSIIIVKQSKNIIIPTNENMRINIQGPVADVIVVGRILFATGKHYYYFNKFSHSILHQHSPAYRKALYCMLVRCVCLCSCLCPCLSAYGWCMWTVWINLNGGKALSIVRRVCIGRSLFNV